MAENMIDLNGLVHVWSKVKTLTDNCVKASDLATVATSGSYNDLSDKPTIPSAYTLPTASNTVMGGVKIGSNISVSSGTISITKSNVTSALGYTPPTSDTVYNNATTSTAGLMSASDKVKLNSIAANANNYIHPASHPASMITGLAAVATSGSYSDLSNKPTIPVVPTNVSAFINDAGYLTQHQSLDDYAKKTDVNTALADKLGINDTAAAAIKDGAGNTISTTYTSKADVSALLSTKLGVTATAYAAARDGAGNNIVDTYARKTDIPNITVDAELSSTSPNPVQNKVIKVALDGKLGKNDTAVNASKVNNLTVETAVPKNAKFTDTVYMHPSTHPASMITGLASVATSGSYNDLANKPGDATTSSAGLMSAADKSKLDGISSDAGSVKMIVYS